MTYGFVRVAVATPSLKVADVRYNSNIIINMIKKSKSQDAQIILFPELSVTGYTCGDLFLHSILLKGAEDALENIMNETKDLDIVSIIGMPINLNSGLYNCAVVTFNGKILGIVPKTHIPNYSEFYEKRWFSSSKQNFCEEVILCNQKVPFGTKLIFNSEKNRELRFAIEICEDLWVPTPPSNNHSMYGANIIFNLSASNELIGKHEYRKDLIKIQSSRCICAYIYASSSIDESSTDLVFGGYSCVYEYGTCLSESTRFISEDEIIFSDIDLFKLESERRRVNSFFTIEESNGYRNISFNLKVKDTKSLLRYIDPHPFVPSNQGERDKRCEEIFNIQISALSKRYKKTGFKKAVIGISGGLDSTLAFLVIVKTFDKLNIDRKNIIAITMPGFGTTGATYNNSVDLIKSSGATLRKIDIKEVCLKHFDDIGHEPKNLDVTYENVQARERTQILMDIANKEEALVIGTGDLSELALGWCTYNGDHMSMYGVNSSIPKTLVRYLVKWVSDKTENEKIAKTLEAIIDTPITPELLPPSIDGKIAQKTEDIIGPYELHDFFIYHMLRYGEGSEKILYLASIAFDNIYNREYIIKYLEVFYKRFFSQQFKRSCMPDGPKVGTISLSPRGDWRMPSDAESNLWLDKLLT